MSVTKKATGNIKHARFVKPSSTQDGYVTQAGAGEKCYGVSATGTRRVPLDGLDTGYLAAANETLEVVTPACDERPLLMIGSGGCAPGDRLKSGSDGEGIVTVTNLDEIGAIAEETASQYTLARVRLLHPTQVSAA